MGYYRNKQTGELEQTWDGTAHDERLASDPSYEQLSEEQFEKLRAAEPDAK